MCIFFNIWAELTNLKAQSKNRVYIVAFSILLVITNWQRYLQLLLNSELTLLPLTDRRHMAQNTRLFSSIPPLSILRSSEKCHHQSMATFSTFCPSNPVSLSRPSSIFHHRCSSRFLNRIRSMSGSSDVRGWYFPLFFSVSSENVWFHWFFPPSFLIDLHLWLLQS